MSLFVRKPMDALMNEASEIGTHTLKRTLGAGGLIALGIGAIIGAGLFSITGMAAANHAGPAITISFVVAAMGCLFAGLCYAEFASMIPVAGSAYTYSYATMGEFIAWIIGWDLVLEYAVGAATVGISWSRYLVKFLEGFDIHLPESLTVGPWDGGIINLPAVFIIVIMSLLLMKGTKESAFVNGIIVALKIAVVLVFIFLGWHYINNDNYNPYIPDNSGEFGNFGFSGIIRAAAIVFFAYITSYTSFAGKDGIAPVAIAIDHMGTTDANGALIPDYPWLNRAIVVAILAGYASVILVMLMGQSRVFFSMSKDGLIPKVFSAVNPITQTPAKSNLLFMVFVSAFAAFVPARVVGEMTSIGTLFAFILVCIGVWVMRNKMPDLPRAFKTPFVPLVPILGIFVCLFMMVFLPMDTWIRLLVWMLIGMDIYLVYGAKHSHLGNGTNQRKGMRIARYTSLALCLLLIIVGFLHQYGVGFESDRTLFYISLSFAVIHLVVFGRKIGRIEPAI
ncbi:MAG: amino acid permease [Saprospiraceae bacterium]|nr:amino acid permease [Saprospiraceae bacterium]